MIGLLFIFADVALATSLPNGGVISAEISTVGEVDEFTFDAVAGDSILLRVADTETTELINSSFFPRIELFDPSGAFVDSGQGFLVGGIFERLVVSGEFTVRVFDNSTGNDETGSYDLYFAQMPGANEGGGLPNGGVVSEDIELGDIDSYTFQANAGDSILLRVADTETTEFVNSDFFPRIELYGPDGGFLEGGQGFLVGGIAESLVATGTYTVLVFDNSSGSDAIGSYDLYFAKMPGANEGNGISGGETVDGFIDLGDIDSFAFSAGNLGTSVTFTLTDLDESDLFPRMELYSPSGSFVTSGQGFLTAQITNQTLVQPGAYTLLVFDNSSGSDAIGNYRLNAVGNIVGVSNTPTTCNGLAITVDIGAGDTPTTGDDVILGTAGADTINSLAGNDTICALGGDDNINAGGGDDWIDAGAGDDRVLATAGDDMIFGGTGDDEILAGSGNDIVEGEEGDDTLFGQPGNDLIDGGDGVDAINGGGGIDTIFTGPGATVGTGKIVTGNVGNDIINGGPDADELRGFNGLDTINGGGGNDVISGGDGRDTIDGGAGNDDIRGQNGIDLLSGGSGNDFVNGGSDNDTINGGPGTDELIGGPGDDIINGDSGNDDIEGGSGNDDMSGGSGSGDSCNGQSGTDTADSSCEIVVGVP